MTSAVNKIAIFKCYNATLLAIGTRELFYVEWFRDNSTIPMRNSHHIFIKDELLSIKNVQQHDTGVYQCLLSSKDPNTRLPSERSRRYFLSIKDDLGRCITNSGKMVVV